MKDLANGLGVSLILLALLSPMAYCTVQYEISKANVKIACIHAGGKYSAWWGGRCDLPTHTLQE